jgi:hypothetical protein
MRFGFKFFALGSVLAFGIVGCGGGAGSEPSEAQMKDAMEFAPISRKKHATIRRRKVSDAPSM